jgi:L-asparaginase/Glu-tRNA(Gln) amidotransferase subunit D
MMSAESGSAGESAIVDDPVLSAASYTASNSQQDALVALNAGNYDAIVIESYGVGGIPQDAEDSYLAKIERLTSMNKTVVIASQVMLEGSDADVYEVGYRSIHNYHALQSYDMTIEAAITKLMWILAQTGDAEKIRRLFLTPVSHDISHWVDMS